MQTYTAEELAELIQAMQPKIMKLAAIVPYDENAPAVGAYKKLCLDFELANGSKVIDEQGQIRRATDLAPVR